MTTPSQLSELAVVSIAQRMGARLDIPHPSIAITKYEGLRTPLHQKVLYVVGALGFFVALAFNNFH